MWDLSSRTKDQSSLHPCLGSAESWPLDHQGNPGSWIILYFPPLQGNTLSWLFGMCLIWNNTDLFSFRSPILNAGTSLPKVLCHVWILASNDSLRSDYRASQMTTTNEALLRIHRKSKGSFVFWSCYVDHLKFDNVHIHQPMFQPYILLGCLGHNRCLLGMWFPSPPPHPRIWHPCLSHTATSRRQWEYEVCPSSEELPCSLYCKESACNAGDLGSIPGLGRSSGEGNGNLLQYSCLENPMNRGAWWATVHALTKRQTRLSD